MTNLQHFQSITDLAGDFRTSDTDASESAILASYAALRDEVDAHIAERVAVARTMGTTWQTIGDALRVSKQAAQQRYGA
jgi:hypothetical protein